MSSLLLRRTLILNNDRLMDETAKAIPCYFLIWIQQQNVQSLKLQTYPLVLTEWRRSNHRTYRSFDVLEYIGTLFFRCIKIEASFRYIIVTEQSKWLSRFTVGVFFYFLLHLSACTVVCTYSYFMITTTSSINNICWISYDFCNCI